MVRRRFLKWSSVALLVITPFTIHATWGFIESRRLQSAIEAIEAKGEPTRRLTPMPSGDVLRAERYYRAAAALVSRYSNDPTTALAVAATRTGDLSPELARTLRTYLEDYRTALQLMDWAAPLPFAGFGEVYLFVSYELLGAVRLSYLQALLHAVDGNADAAGAAIYTAIRGGRQVEGDLNLYQSSFRAVTAIKPVLERTRLTTSSLTHIADALAEADRDDIFRAQFLALRVELLRRRPADPWFIGPSTQPIFAVNRPLRTHRLVAQFAAIDRLLQAASNPWPARIDAIADTDATAFSGVVFEPGIAERSRRGAVVNAAASALAVHRAMRILIAVERYRRDHGEQLPPDVDALVPAYLDSAPIDPFTGKPLRYVREADGYVAYSVGPNRQDDGGDVVIQWKDGARSAPDPGVGIRYAK
jgi:hypothetical protein